MKKVVILYEERYRNALQANIIILKEIWADMEYSVEELAVRPEVSPDIYVNKLVMWEEEFLITFTMAGLEWPGMTEQPRFNALGAMQIHILPGNLPCYDSGLRREYGIHSFFVTDCRDIFADWKIKYPQIPFMHLIPALYLGENLTEEQKEINRTNLRQMLQRVLAYIDDPQPL